MAETRTPLLHVENLKQYFKISRTYTTKAVDGISFDIYEGENVGADEKSVAFKLKFSDPCRTLTDDEVMTIFNKVIDKVVATYKAQLRDK